MIVTMTADPAPSVVRTTKERNLTEDEVSRVFASILISRRKARVTGSSVPWPEVWQEMRLERASYRQR